MRRLCLLALLLGSLEAVHPAAAAAQPPPPAQAAGRLRVYLDCLD